jgi:2'-5' RNA ligase
MRLFLCTFLDAGNQAFYAGLVAAISGRVGSLLRAVPSGSVHLTYAFFPQVEDAHVADVVRAVEAVAARGEPMAIGLGTPRVLHARAEARLVMADVNRGGEPLGRMVEDLRRELGQRLPDVTMGQGQAAHATLARFRRGTRRRAAAPVTAMLAAATDTERDDTIAGIQVVSSELLPEGPRYVTMASVPLHPRTRP